MIRLPKTFFSNLSLTQYREYLKLLPKLKDEKAQFYTMLAYTLIALSFFGIFAINPTLSTIAELKRKIADLQFVYQKYDTKIQALSILQDSYRPLSGDLLIVDDAMPQKPEVTKLVAQMNALLNNSRLHTTSLKVLGTEITQGRKPLNKNISSFIFTIEATGTYDDMLFFIQSAINANRLITIETISISKDDNENLLVINLRGRSYFKQ